MSHIVFLLFLLPLAASQRLSTLQSLQIFFRHGQRAPTEYVTFPSEGPDAAQNFSVEAGEMTNKGIMQEYLLGETLMKEYGDFIGNRYVASKLDVQSGTDNRTVASALAVLAALFKPTSSQIWNADLLWQPVPVHTDELLDHTSFGATDHCPALYDYVLLDQDYKRLNAEDADFKRFLSEKTGIDVTDVFVYQRVLDTFLAREGIEELPLPEWANSPNFLSDVRAKRLALHSDFIDIFLPQSGGYLWDILVSQIENRLYFNTGHMLHLFAVHDSSIQTIGKFLNVAALNANIEFSAYLAFEHHLRNGRNIIEMWYSPSGNSTRSMLEIPSCGCPCYFENFSKLGHRVSRVDWLHTCRGEPPFCDDYSVVLAVLLFLTILLVILSVLLLFVCCSYRKRLNKLLDPELHCLLDGNSS